MWINFVYASRSFGDLQSCNWKQDQPHWLCSSISKYSAVQIILLVFCWVHLRHPLNSGAQMLPFIYSYSQKGDIRFWPVNGKRDISKNFQYLLLCSPTEKRLISAMLGSPEAVLALHAFLWHEDMTCSLCLLCLKFTESAPLCSILKVRYLCIDCGQRHKKFPFLKKKINLILFTSLPPFFLVP